MNDYPLSSPVIPGQATEADQYNFLRRDALYLGADPLASGTIYDLLNASGEASLTRSGTNEISLNAPLSRLINGTICTVVSAKSVTVPEGLYPDAVKLYVTALPDGAGSFSPQIKSVPAESDCVLGRFLWDGSAIVPNTVKSGDPESGSGAVTQGRLTVVSGEPCPETDISFAERIYFTPFGGHFVELFCGGVWERFSFSEMSFSLSGLSQNTVYDLFLYADGTGLHLTAVPWGTLGARPAGLLSWRDGVRVSAADPQKKYLGSFALNGSGSTADTRQCRLLWNAWNRIPRPLEAYLAEEVESEACTPDVWAPLFGDDAPEVRTVIGTSDGITFLHGTASTAYQSAADASAQRYAVFGISRNMKMESPYTGNTSAAAAAWTYGAALQTPELVSHETGLSRWTLSVYANYPFLLNGSDPQSGAAPALVGMVMS